MATFGYRTLLTTYLGPLWRRVAALGALVLGDIALQLANPLLVRAFLDRAAAQAALATLLTIAVIFMVVAVGDQILAVIATALATGIGWRATNRLRTDLLRHCLGLDLAFHAANPPGALVERVDGDVEKLSNFFSQFTVQLAGNGLLLIGIIIVSFTIDWRIGLTLALCAALTIVALWALRGVGVSAWERQRQTSADLFGFVEERLSGTEDLRALGATGVVTRGLALRWRAYISAFQRAVVVGDIPFFTMLLAMSITLAASLATGLWLYTHGMASIGTLYLVFAYATQLQRPVEEISRQLQDLQQASAGVRRSAALLCVTSAIVDGAGDVPSAASLAFDHVTFGYQSDQPTVRDVSFAVRPGARLGVLGRTGSGKTTIARLLFRFYDPDQGAIRLNGADLRDLRLDDLRRRVGLVTQDIQLFHASARDNLTFFDATIPDERIQAALDELGLGDWWRGLPEGLATPLAPDGAGLSAGEAQLLAFARVFLKDPAIVVLDEASSRLDPATERALEAAIERLLEGRMAIIIAHRLHTIQTVDEVLILEDGVVAEYGPRAELAARDDSRFAALLRVGLEGAAR